VEVTLILAGKHLSEIDASPRRISSTFLKEKTGSLGLLNAIRTQRGLGAFSTSFTAHSPMSAPCLKWRWTQPSWRGTRL
jgi:hypothetical protein